jgi:hypothetical protein
MAAELNIEFFKNNVRTLPERVYGAKAFLASTGKFYVQKQRPSGQLWEEEGSAPTPEPLEILDGKTLYVDSTYGDDATAVPNSRINKYKTIQAAVTDAGLPFVSGGFFPEAGTGYPTFTPTEATVTGGSGEGLVINYTSFGFATVLNSIVSAGSGYINGEIVTVNGGDNNMTFQIATSLSEDTVVIGAGTYTTTGNIAKENVTLHSDHNPLIQGSTTILSDNGGAIPFIKVTGNIRFECLSAVNPINFTGTSTRWQIDCESILLRQGIRLLSDGHEESYIRATEFIRNSFGLNYVFTFATGINESESVYNIYTKRIDSTAGGSAIRQCFNVIGALNGKINIFVDEFTSNTSTPAALIYSANGGSGSINIKGFTSEYATLLDNPLSRAGSNFFWNYGALVMSQTLNIKANIYQRANSMFLGYSNGAKFNFEGTFYNESRYSIFRRDSGNAELNFNGTLYNDVAPTAILSATTGGQIKVNGEIYQKTVNGEAAAGGVAVVKRVAAGSGIAGQTYTENVATTGGSGSGCVVSIMRNASGFGGASIVWVTDGGEGYSVGETLTAVVGGNDCTFTVEAVEPTGIGVLSNATDVIIDDLKVVNDQPLSYAFQGITPGVPTSLIVTKVLTTNVTSNNYTDLVPASLKIENTNVQ